MEAQLIKKFIGLTIIFMINVFLSYGQHPVKKESSDLSILNINKKYFYSGDTVKILIKNNATVNKGYTIEVYCLNKGSYYNEAVYSAYFNNDTAFFNKLKQSKELSEKNKNDYILPDFSLIPYFIKPGTKQELNFIIKGAPVKKGILMKFVITTDLTDNNPKIIYSKPFYIFTAPDLTNGDPHGK